MKAFDGIQRIVARHDETMRELANLEEQAAQAEATWQAAVASGDFKGEAAALKAMSTAHAAMEGPRKRLPVLQEALRRERRECLPSAAAEVADLLKAANDEAVPLARQLLEHYEAARLLAKEINRLGREHVDAMRSFREMCQQSGDVVPIPHSGRFLVNLGQMNFRFRPDAEERFRLTERSLLINQPKGDTNEHE